jgi:hypothetical protein
MARKSVPGLSSVFVFRSNLMYQNSLQSTVEQTSIDRALPIPRTGTSAPIGAPTMVHRPIPPER